MSPERNAYELDRAREDLLAAMSALQKAQTHIRDAGWLFGWTERALRLMGRKLLEIAESLLLWSKPDKE